MRSNSTNQRIGLFYGSSTCYTEMASEKIAAKITELRGEEIVDVHNIALSAITVAEDYDFLLLGIPTWDYGELQEDWENIWDDIDDVDFNGKVIAIFGLGDQVGYPEWFLDAMGYLWAKVTSLGAKAVGYWPVDGFEFEKSKALTADKSQFLGLALDDENEFDLTDERIHHWCVQVLNEFGL